MIYLFLKNYCEVFSKSKHNQELMSSIHNVPVEYFNISTKYTSYNASYAVQMRSLFKRSFFGYFKNYHVFLIDLLMAFVSFFFVKKSAFVERHCFKIRFLIIFKGNGFVRWFDLFSKWTHK